MQVSQEARAPEGQIQLTGKVGHVGWVAEANASLQETGVRNFLGHGLCSKSVRSGQVGSTDDTKFGQVPLEGRQAGDVHPCQQSLRLNLHLQHHHPHQLASTVAATRIFRIWRDTFCSWAETADLCILDVPGLASGGVHAEHGEHEAGGGHGHHLAKDRVPRSDHLKEMPTPVILVDVSEHLKRRQESGVLLHLVSHLSSSTCFSSLTSRLE